jgi:valine--pyruvate aminotransferase
MMLSEIGEKMSAMSGLRSIMDDIAMSVANAGSEPWINLSIGNPASIPAATKMWRELTEQAISADFELGSCSYGPSRGMPQLVSAIVDYFNGKYEWGIGPQNVVVGPGSQMLCFIAAAIFAGGRPDSRVLLPLTPDYTGYQGLCLHADGVAGIEPVIERTQDRYFRYVLDQDAVERRSDIGMLLLSSPSNPAGRSLAAAELTALVNVSEVRDIPLLIDNAYGQPFPQIGPTYVPPPFTDTVINCFSLSKAGLPGERVGFAVAPEKYISPMVSFIANSVLHASSLPQATVALALRSGQLDTLSAAVLSPFYARRKQLAEELLADILPADINWRVHAGQAGMFCWLWIDEPWFSDVQLYQRLKLKHVFVAPGRSFFLDTHVPPRTNWHGTQCIRISLSAEETKLAEGIKRMAAALRELQAGL